MKVIYVGPLVEVNIREFDLTARRNEAITVPDAIGKRLVRQAVWEEEGKPKDRQDTPPATGRPKKRG